MAEYIPEFFVTGDRFTELLVPDIQKSIKELSSNDMIGLLQVKSQSVFLVSFISNL